MKDFISRQYLIVVQLRDHQHDPGRACCSVERAHGRILWMCLPEYICEEEQAPKTTAVRRSRVAPSILMLDAMR